MTEAIRLTEALLEGLAAQWRRHDAPIARRLAPGLSDPEMDALAEPLALKVPPEARTWWRWHDGAQNGFVVTSGGKAFSSLEQCLSLAAEMREIAHEVARPYHLSADEADEMARGVWNWDWLPLCQDGWGGMLVIDAAIAGPTGDVSPVLWRANEDGSDAAALTPSIGALVRQWTTALEAGTGSHNEQGDRWALDLNTLPAGYDERLL